MKKPSFKKNTAAKAVTTPFKWTVEMVNDLLDVLLEYKTEREYNNIDFNADKVQLYEVVRVKMAGKYSEAEESLFISAKVGRARPRDVFSSCNCK